MVKICDKKNCLGCSSCKNICPCGAISMQADSEGFLYPLISDKCINCGKCIKACPVNNSPQYPDGICDIYAIQLIDKDILIRSTSGGAFILLSNYVLDKGGVVFGAAYDDNMVVKHTEAKSIEEVFPMQGSKYVQSNIGQSYSSAKKYLDADKYVLFSGTPCQIEGLCAFLGKEYEKLILLDIICGGVPSPLLFKLYLENLQEKNSSKVIDYKFRDKKDYGCSHTTVITEKINGKEQRTVIPDRTQISYFNAFGHQAYTRPSCYDCKYNDAVKRLSDFTCGGYFGANDDIKALGEYEGISTLVLHTSKGIKIFDELKSKVKYLKISPEDAKEGNSMLYKSVPQSQRCPEMFCYLNKHGYEKTAKKYFQPYRQSFIKKLIPDSLKSNIKKHLHK